MNPSDPLSYFFLLIAVTIAVVSANPYTTITNDNVKTVNSKITYASLSDKVLAEGTAVKQGLKSLKELQANFAGRGTLVFSCSTGYNGITFVKGEAMRLDDLDVTNPNKPSTIIVAYTHNYGHRDPVVRKLEFDQFAATVSHLETAADNHGINFALKRILVAADVLSAYYGDESNLKLSPTDAQKQTDTIVACIKEDTLEATNIGLEEFKTEIVKAEVKMLYDGIVGSGAFEITPTNLMLVAIARAHISAMCTAIIDCIRLHNNILRVLANDAPSGVNENGDWLSYLVGYPVHILLSYGWNKALVNSAALAGATVRVLNVQNSITTFLEELANIIGTWGNGSANLAEDIKAAKAIKMDHSIGFEVKDNRMVPVEAVAA